MTVHPLQEVRDAQVTKKHNRDLSGLIKQAIVDQIKKTGECFPEDLIPLYPKGEVDECRRLATARFGSMVKEGLIHETGRRKSSIVSRKGAKSGVFSFTQKGREQLAGVGGGSHGVGASSFPTTHSGEKPAPVVHQQTTGPGAASLQAPGQSSESLAEPLTLFPEPAHLTDVDQRRAA